MNKQFITYEQLKKDLNLSAEEWVEIDAEVKETINRMKLKEIRTVKNISQAELAKKANIPRSTLARFESGKANPTIKNLAKIAAAMDMKLEIKLSPLNK